MSVDVGERERGELVRLRAAAKRYRWNGPWVLSAVDVALEPGVAVDVRGANGTGKSTLLRLLAGASAPTRGARVAAAGLAVGYAPERLAPPPFSAAGYLRHHVRVRVAGEAEVGALAERLGFAHLLGERMAALSKGSLQKVVLTQALLGAPRLIVLDEPFSGLDADAQRSLRELIDERRRDGAAVAFSDHREAGDGARPAADRVWLVEGGEVRASAAPAAAFAGATSAAAPAAPARERLRVPAADSDRTLGELLARGRHVVRVEPAGDGEVLIETAAPAGPAAPPKPAAPPTPAAPAAPEGDRR